MPLIAIMVTIEMTIASSTSTTDYLNERCLFYYVSVLSERRISSCVDVPSFYDTGLRYSLSISLFVSILISQFISS